MPKLVNASLSLEEREQYIQAVEDHGTILAACKAIGIPKAVIHAEMKQFGVFKRRVEEAREIGKRNMADNALAIITSYAYGATDANGEKIKTDKNQLTAAIALANAYEPGFRGTTKTESKVDHYVRVLTAVPRPKYKELPPPPKIIEVNNEPKKRSRKTKG
uniref:Uncharacterized protein n=1 Tax=viral metagenome TaxID=1070528 RepID=A0A6M3JN46_9ZZZZ